MNGLISTSDASVFLRRARQRHHELHRAADVLGLEAELECDLARLERLQPKAGNQILLDDCVGILGGDLLDLHATCCRGHKYQPARTAIEHDTEIEFARNRQRLFDQQPLHFLAFGPSLMGDQIHAEDFARQFGGFFR